MNNGAIDTMKTLLQPGPGSNLLFLWVGLAVIVGILIGYLIFSTIRKNQDEKLKRTAENIIDQAKEIAKSTELDAKDAALKITQQAESDIQHSRNERGRFNTSRFRRTASELISAITRATTPASPHD